MKNVEYSGNTFTIRKPKSYAVDFDKVDNFEDLKKVVQILFAGLRIRINEDCGFTDEVKEYLIEMD